MKGNVHKWYGVWQNYDDFSNLIQRYVKIYTMILNYLNIPENI